MNAKEVKKIKEDFDSHYFFNEPHRQYVSMTGVYRRRDIAHLKNTHLMEGETLDDLCIRVSLKKTPPKEVDFPAEYQGMPVAYLLDEIVLHLEEA